MFAFGSFSKFIDQELPYMEENSFEMPITIGILVCDIRQQYCRENIFNYMNHFNRFSGEYINFYIPGYCSKREMNELKQNGYDKFYKDSYNLKGQDFYFSEKYFDEFIFELRSRYQIAYEGVAELILVEVYNGRINWDKKIRFLLQALQDEKKISTVYSFFDKIFEYAKKYVNIQDFSDAGRIDKCKDSFFEIVKHKIPEEIKILNGNDKIYRIK